MAAVPRIADVQCSRLKFEPGQICAVYVYHNLTVKERQKLTKAVERWCGAPVMIFDGRFIQVRQIKHPESPKQIMTVSDLVYPLE